MSESKPEPKLHLSSWIDIPAQCDFSLYNIPFGVFYSLDNLRPRCCTAIGKQVIDLSILEEAGLFLDMKELESDVFGETTLNRFIAHPHYVWKEVRQRIIHFFTAEELSNDRDNIPSFVKGLKQNQALINASCLRHRVEDVTMCLPCEIGDYTDFYSSREHATNVGTMFRGKDNALQPNWLHLPVGYHGRSSTVFVSGTDVVRPCGQIQKDIKDPKQGSIYSPCKKLDFELEMAFFVGGSKQQQAAGQPLTIQEAKERIFGFVLMNDWSARDIQKWEYVPLGPFTAKNFATSISPWIITTVALEENGFIAQTSCGAQQTEPQPLSYLFDEKYSSYDINLSVAIQPSPTAEPSVISVSNFKNLYWNAAQQLVHHSITGCIMKPGDLLGSGTISGQTQNSYGSMLELSWGGKNPISLNRNTEGNEESNNSDVETRTYLQDGDAVIMKGWCQRVLKDSDSDSGIIIRVGFGECTGRVLPASPICVQNQQVQEDVKEEEKESSNKTSDIHYDDFKLYGYWKSSSTWRIRIALTMKNVKYDYVPINLMQEENKTPEYLNISPLGQIPLLEFVQHNTQSNTSTMYHLSQTVAIIDFLDQIFPSKKSIMPRPVSGCVATTSVDATIVLEKAMAHEMIEIINSGIQPLQNGPLLEELEILSNDAINGTEFAKNIIVDRLMKLERLVLRRLKEKAKHGQSGGPYCLGTFSPSVVEIFLVPQLYNARKRYQIDDLETICPYLVGVERLCSVHPWFVNTYPHLQPDAPKE